MKLHNTNAATVEHQVVQWLRDAPRDAPEQTDWRVKEGSTEGTLKEQPMRKETSVSGFHRAS